MTEKQCAYAEEVLSGLFFIASGVFLSAGHETIATVLACKAAWDTICAMIYWHRNALKRRKQANG